LEAGLGQGAAGSEARNASPYNPNFFTVLFCHLCVLFEILFFRLNAAHFHAIPSNRVYFAWNV
jgi:hypothetical protein